ncbi:MAG: hypothetical protein WBA10_16660, partial [Elainellaceae cyanobacterium]
MVDRAGSTRRTAKRLGVLVRPRQVRDRLGLGDRTDMYNFRLSHSSRVTLTLSRTRNKTRLTLLSQQGQAIQQRQGRRRRTLRAVLEAGRYFIRVGARARRDDRAIAIPYHLTVRPKPLPTTPQPVPPASSDPVTPAPVPPTLPTPPPPSAPRPSLPPDLLRYDFTYHYRPNTADGERYQGYVITSAQMHRLGWYDANPRASESGLNGRYKITRVSDYSDARQKDNGLVFVTRYTDVNTGRAKAYSPYYQSQGLP